MQVLYEIGTLDYSWVVLPDIFIWDVQYSFGGDRTLLLRTLEEFSKSTLLKVSLLLCTSSTNNRKIFVSCAKNRQIVARRPKTTSELLACGAKVSRQKIWLVSWCTLFAIWKSGNTIPEGQVAEVERNYTLDWQITCRQPHARLTNYVSQPQRASLCCANEAVLAVLLIICCEDSCRTTMCAGREFANPAPAHLRKISDPGPPQIPPRPGPSKFFLPQRGESVFFPTQRTRCVPAKNEIWLSALLLLQDIINNKMCKFFFESLCMSLL